MRWGEATGDAETHEPTPGILVHPAGRRHGGDGRVAAAAGVVRVRRRVCEGATPRRHHRPRLRLLCRFPRRGGPLRSGHRRHVARTRGSVHRFLAGRRSRGPPRDHPGRLRGPGRAHRNHQRVDHGGDAAQRFAGRGSRHAARRPHYRSGRRVDAGVDGRPGGGGATGRAGDDDRYRRGPCWDARPAAVHDSPSRGPRDVGAPRGFRRARDSVRATRDGQRAVGV